MAGGGSRPGAGRKPRAVKYERPINRAEKQIVDHLPELIDNLLQLAHGGYEQVTEEYAPAGTVTIGDGDALQLVFPDKQPDELVLVKVRREIANKDRAANIDLVNRILGKPVSKTEIDGALELSGRGGGPVQLEGSFDFDAFAQLFAATTGASAGIAGADGLPQPLVAASADAEAGGVPGAAE